MGDRALVLMTCEEGCRGAGSRAASGLAFQGKEGRFACRYAPSGACVRLCDPVSVAMGRHLPVPQPFNQMSALTC